MTRSRIIELDKFDLDLSDFEPYEPVENAVELLRREFYECIRVWAGYYDDRLLVLWGIRAPSIFSDDVYIWMAATKFLKEHPMVFLRHCREGLRVLEAYPKLKGFVLCDFEVSKRWLRWLGFTVGEPNGRVCEFWR